MAQKITGLNGEIVAVASEPTRRWVVAFSTESDVKVLTFPEEGPPVEDAQASALTRAALNGLTERTPSVRAEFLRDTLCVGINHFQLNGGGTSAVLAVDLATSEVRELCRFDGLFTTPPIVAIDDRFVLAGVYEDQEQTEDWVGSVRVFDLSNRTQHELLRLDFEKDGVAVPVGADTDEDADWEGVRPLISHLAYAPPARRLYLVTQDPDQGEGNRIRAVTLDMDCRAVGVPEPLLHEIWEPYSPVVGGACASPHRDEAVAVMYASEWEKFVPISAMPGESDFLPAADLHVARAGEPARRLAVLGQLGVNIAFYDREAEAPNLPDRFRIHFDFGNAGSEVTPVIALGPDRYLIALFGGTLTEINIETGKQSVVERFGEPITALQNGFDPGTVFVGLVTGEFFTVAVPQGA
ncbi:MAG: hypothetical protein H8F28_15045 [Fibrella sp.]|nr:hypothetical protein [Armatimonadota bacterium]